MDKVIIHKPNEAFIQVECEQGILLELHEHFSFYAKNYRWDPRFKRKQWDGKIRILRLKDNSIYTGLLPRIQEFCQKMEYEIEYADESILNLPNFSIEEAREYAESLNIHSRGEKLEIREYQILAFAKAIRHKRNLILSPTSSGKSLIYYLVVRYLLDHRDEFQGILIVPTIQLVEQMFKDFQDYSSENGWIAEDFVQKIHQDYTKEITHRLAISTWQSLYNFDPEYFQIFNFFAVDEAHGATAKSLKYIAEACCNADYRLGMTGTLEDLQVHQWMLEGVFGPITVTITTDEMIKKGYASKFQIKALVLKYQEDERKQLKALVDKVDGQKKYSTEINWLVSNEKRYRYIVNLALSLKGNTLILFRLVDKHGKVLHQKMEKKIAKGRSLYYVSGETEVEIREQIREFLEKEDNAIFIASIGTLSTGINIKNLKNLIFASPNKTKIKTLQAIGRLLRLLQGKEIATLYDIVDDLTVGKKPNYAVKHFVERAKYYAKEKFPLKVYNIEL